DVCSSDLSRGTTAESRRRRSLHDIHLFQVERIPVIAAKIAHSIDVKIVTGAETANRQVIALRAAFARRDTDARDIAQRIAQGGSVLLPHRLLADHAHGLGRVA